MLLTSHRRGYFFDLDGTLVDTHESNLAAYSAAIKRVLPGRLFDSNELLKRISEGQSSMQFLPAILSGLTDAELAEINACKAELYPDYIELSKLNTDLVNQAWQWKQLPNVVLVLVTTAKQKNAEAVLMYHKINGLFDYCIFGDGITRLKPAPDIYIKALEISGLCADDVEAYEDSDVGVAAARLAGIAVTRVAWTS